MFLFKSDANYYLWDPTYYLIFPDFYAANFV